MVNFNVKQHFPFINLLVAGGANFKGNIVDFLVVFLKISFGGELFITPIVCTLESPVRFPVFLQGRLELELFLEAEIVIEETTVVTSQYFSLLNLKLWNA